MPHQVLVIENNLRQRQQIVAALLEAGFEVNAVSHFPEAHSMFKKRTPKFDAVVIEETVGDGKGLKLLGRILVKCGRLPVAVITRGGNWRSYLEAVGMGAIAYLPHPVNTDRLVAVLKEATTVSRKKPQDNQ